MPNTSNPNLRVPGLSYFQGYFVAELRQFTMETLQERYQALMAIRDIAQLPVAVAIKHVGELIDISSTLNQSDGGELAIELCKQLRAREISSADAALLHYFEANVWAARCPAKPTGPGTWDWMSEAFSQEILHLRLARRGEGFQRMHRVRRCQIRTNLGNALSYLGRFTEALDQFDEALAEDADFAMARGNRAICLARCAFGLPHLPHEPGLCTTSVFFREAHASLMQVSSSPVDPNTRRIFDRWRAAIEDRLPNVHSTDGYDQQRRASDVSPPGRRYRRWCLRHRLFLNLLNDLGPNPAAESDVLHVPHAPANDSAWAYFQGFYNLLKQEYTSARYLYYRGIRAHSPHFCDRGVLLYETHCDGECSWALEQIKAAYRILYSLFDKIGFFLNSYLRLGIKPEQVNFRKLWYQSQDRKNGLKPEFAGRQNWAMRGLFWLSNDLYTDDAAFRDSLDPDAQDLALIRNHIEHKYLRVRHGDANTGPHEGEDAAFLSYGPSYALSRRDLEARTLRVLKLARSALVYLAFSVHPVELT